MAWVRFHQQLCEDEKTGLPRSTRFVYMELSMRARARRGFIVLPQGKPDIKAVQLLLSGNAKEVEAAVAHLSEGKDPMIRFEDRDGKRLLIVEKWDKWNPNGDDSTKRVRNWREEKKRQLRNGDGNALHDVSVTGETKDRAYTSARARATLTLSSDLDSSSELSDPTCQVIVGSDPQSEVRLVVAPSTLPDERYVSKDDKLTKELRDAAGIIGVKDIETAWLSFCGSRDGQWHRVSGAWQAYCAKWRSNEQSARDKRRPDGPVSPDDPYHAPEARKARDEAAARQREAEFAANRRDAVPMPAAFRDLLGRKGTGT